MPTWFVGVNGHKRIYRDLDIAGYAETDGSFTLDVRNVSPAPVRNLTIYKASTPDEYDVKILQPGETASIKLGKALPGGAATFLFNYATHHGLPHSSFEDVVFGKRDAKQGKEGAQ